MICFSSQEAQMWSIETPEMDTRVPRWTFSILTLPDACNHGGGPG